MTQAAFLNPSDAMVSTHAGTIAGERFQVLDSWRGICALLVALFHFPTASAISQSRFIASSYLFVDFFFVLSGFVIAFSIRAGAILLKWSLPGFGGPVDEEG